MELGYFDGQPAERIAGDESGTAMKRSRVASDLHLRSGRSTPLMHRKGHYEGGDSPGPSGFGREWAKDVVTQSASLGNTNPFKSSYLYENKGTVVLAIGLQSLERDETSARTSGGES